MTQTSPHLSSDFTKPAPVRPGATGAQRPRAVLDRAGEGAGAETFRETVVRRAREQGGEAPAQRAGEAPGGGASTAGEAQSPRTGAQEGEVAGGNAPRQPAPEAAAPGAAVDEENEDVAPVGEPVLAAPDEAPSATAPAAPRVVVGARAEAPATEAAPSDSALPNEQSVAPARIEEEVALAGSRRTGRVETRAAQTARPSIEKIDAGVRNGGSPAPAAERESPEVAAAATGRGAKEAKLGGAADAGEPAVIRAGAVEAAREQGVRQERDGASAIRAAESGALTRGGSGEAGAGSAEDEGPGREQAQTARDGAPGGRASESAPASRQGVFTVEAEPTDGRPTAPVLGTPLAGRSAGVAQAGGQGATSDGGSALEEAFQASVARGIGAAVRQKGGSLTIRLSPPMLGTLKIQMQIEQGVVTARFDASTEQARELLMANMAHLRSALEGKGLAVDRLHVQVGAQAAHTTGPATDAGKQEANPDSEQQDRSSRQDAGDGRSRGAFDGREDRASERPGDEPGAGARPEDTPGADPAGSFRGRLRVRLNAVA